MRCRLGALGPEQSRNLTWSGDSQLSCYFEDSIHFGTPGDFCVEVSFNGGRYYTTNCLRLFGSTRAPVSLDFNPKQTLIADAATLVITGVGFDLNTRYWCLFIGPADLENNSEATVISTSEIRCAKPFIESTEESHEFEIALYLAPEWTQYSVQLQVPRLAWRFTEKMKNWAYSKLLKVSPDRGDYLGGTPIIIQLNNNPLYIDGHAAAMACRFSSVSAGNVQTAAHIVATPAELIDENHVRCITPDYSTGYADTWTTASMQETYIAVSEFDGTFRERSELRYRFHRRPVIHELMPNEGYASREVPITIRGDYYLNVKDLTIRATDAAADHATFGVVMYQWKNEEILYMDDHHLLISMPAVAAETGRLLASVVRFEISFNAGVDWTTTPTDVPPLYTLLETP